MDSLRASGASRRPTAFLSYSRKEPRAADEVMTSIEAYASCWRDINDILSGAEWAKETLAAVAKQDVVVFLASARSTDPESFCAHELRTAHANGKRVACLAVEPISMASLPAHLEFLKHQQWTSTSQPDWRQRLRADINADFEWVRQHTSVARAHLEHEDTRVKGRLLTGAQLKSALAMLDVRRAEPPVLTEQQRQFIRRSRKRAVVRRWSLVGLVIVLLAAAGVTAEQLIDNHRRGNANALAATACARPDDLGATLIQAAAAMRIAETAQTRACLLTAVELQPQVAALLPALNGASVLAVDPTGRWVAVAGQIDSGGRTLMIWDLASRSVVLPPTVIAGPARSVAAVAFSPDGTRLAVADSSAKIYMLDLTVRPARVLATAQVTDGRVMVGQLAPTLAFTPQGDLMAGGLEVESVVVDVYPGGDLTKRHSIAVPALYYLATADDGRVMLAGDGVHLLTRSQLMATSDLRQRRPDVVTTLRCAPALSADGRWLAYADEKGSVHVRDLSTGHQTAVFSVPEVQMLALSHDGHRLAIDERDTVQIRDPATGRLTESGLRQPGGRTLAFGAGSTLVGGGSDVVIWQLDRTSRILSTTNLVGADRDGLRVLTPDGASVFYSAPGDLVNADARDGRVVQRIQTPTAPYGLAVLDDRRILLLEGATATLWNLPGHGARAGLLDIGPVSCDGGQAPASSLLAVAAVDGTHVVASYGDCGLVMRWDLVSGRHQRLGLDGGMNPSVIAATAAGDVAVGDFGTRDTTGQVVLLRPGATSTPIELAIQRPSALAFDPHGSLLVVGGFGGSQSVLGVIAVEDPHHPRIVPVSGADVSAVAADDGLVAAGTEDGTVKLWTESAPGMPALGAVQVGTEPIDALTFADSGTILRMVTPTRLVSMPLQPGAWLAQVCAVVSPLLDNEFAGMSAQRLGLRRTYRDACRP